MGLKKASRLDRALNKCGVYRSVVQLIDSVMFERFDSVKCDLYLPMTQAVFEQVAAVNQLAAPKLVTTLPFNGGPTVYRDTLYVSTEIEVMSTPEQVFTVAHEMGHIVMQHSVERLKLWTLHAPGMITTPKFRSIIKQVAPELSRLSYAHEYAADQFATCTMLDLGLGLQDIYEAVALIDGHDATDSHPSSGDRIAAILDFYRKYTTNHQKDATNVHH